MEKNKLLSTSERILKVGERINTDSITMKPVSQLKLSTDHYDRIILSALQANQDDRDDLYLHQYKALYALATGKDVLLITPCGSGKTRVLVNGLACSALGMKYRGQEIKGKPLCIVNTPLNSIMEENIIKDSSAGMLSMTGKVKLGTEFDPDVIHDKPEEHFFNGTISRVYGHPESFTSKLGRKILELNQGRICLHSSDELAQFLWGSSFRKVGLQVIPGSNRIFAVDNSPFLAMTATLRKPDEVLEVKKLLGMEDCVIIDFNPVKLNPFYSALLRPSNKTDFYDEEGLCSLLRVLFLDEFVKNPQKQPSCIIFGRQELVLGKVYSFLESELGNIFPNNRTRPFVQYHGATDEFTLNCIHKRIKSPGDHPIKLFLATDKLIMGVDIQDIGVVIYIRPPNTFHAWEQGCGRARGGKGSEFGSKKTVSVVLYNKDDLKSTVDGLTDPIRRFCTTSDCLKQTAATYFGYSMQSNLNSWCCINCLK